MPNIIDIPLPEASSSSATKTETPVFAFKGKPVDPKVVAACVAAGTEPPQPVTIERYLSLLDEQEQVAADIKACEAEIRAFGLTEAMAVNASARSRVVSSVQLVDGLRPGAEVDPETPAVRCTLVNKYSVKQEAVTEWFSSRKVRPVPGGPKPPDINDVLEYTVEASFDASVFVDPETGRYSADRFAAFQAALNQVCETYRTQNPLSVAKKLVVKPDFHDRRWALFSAAENASLHEVLPCGTQLAAVRPKRKKVSRRPSTVKK